MTDFDDMLGGDTPVVPLAPRRGRPTNAERAERAERLMATERAKAEIRAASAGHTKVSEEQFLLPVTMNFLARVLHMDPMTVGKRLRGVKPAGEGSAGRKVYYFHEALPYLLKPKMDIAQYIRTLNPADLPNSINKVYWEAERIKNKVLIETGEAWNDQDVLAVLGRVFMMFKERIPLVTEGMRDEGLTDKQFSKLTEYMDQLQRDLHESLMDMPKERRTAPRRDEVQNTGDAPFGTYPIADDDSE